MSNETLSTPPPVATNTQDFSDSDDDILDNFAEGPDDNVPMGLGGEKGNQAEPASSTLESDIVNGTGKNKPEEASQPENAGDESGEPSSDTQPEQDSGESTDSEPAEPETPAAPELPEVLVKMAGYESAEAAQADGLNSPEVLQAFVRGRGQLLASKPTDGELPSDFYARRGQAAPPAEQKPSAPESEDKAGEEEFSLPEEKLEMLDPDLRELVEGMHKHYESKLSTLQQSQVQRETELAQQQQANESAKFDETVKSLGTDWEEVFGEGDASQLANASQSDVMARAKLEHRMRLFEDVQAVRKVNEERGFQPMSLEQEVQYALMQRYPDKFQQSISGTSSPDSGEKRRGVTASRPTQRRTPPKSQNAKVLSDVNAMLAKRGRSLDMGDGDDFDGEI